MIRLARSVAFAAALLAVAAAAVAMPGAQTERGPQLRLARATAPLAHGNSRAGRAVLTVSNMIPGERRSGEVTIANEGHAGQLYLVAGGLTDTPGPSGARLADRLTMTIAEVGGRQPRTLAAGPLSTIATCVPLGELGAGERRTYRFTVTLPSGPADNAVAGAGARVDYEWLQTAAARAGCPLHPDDQVDLPEEPAAPARTPGLRDVELAIEPGPYRFSGRNGTARVGVRCVAAPAGRCRGRLELERRRSGQGRGIALAVGRFDVAAGRRATVTLRLNARARRRITRTGFVPVRAHVTATGADGRRRRASYRDLLVYAKPRR